MNWENKMGKAYLYAIKKRKCPKKIRTLKKYPTIQRSDVMNCILSEYATSEEKNLLSCMYYEITKMEMKDMKYITEIAISSKEDADIYDLIQRLKMKEKNKLTFAQQ